MRRAAAEAAPEQKPGSASLRCPCVSILLLCDRHLADGPVLSTPPLQMGFSEGLPQGHQRLAASLELGLPFHWKVITTLLEATPLRCKQDSYRRSLGAMEATPCAGPVTTSETLGPAAVTSLGASDR